MESDFAYTQNLTSSSLGFLHIFYQFSADPLLCQKLISGLYLEKKD